MVYRPGPVPVTGPESGQELQGALPSLDVIIPSLNTRELLRETLDTLLAQSGVYPEQVVVVDMSSTDGTPDMVSDAFPEVHVMRDVPNRGYGAAVNAGARAGHGEWILACNSDVEYREPQAVERLLSFATDDTRAGVVGPRLLNEDGTAQCSAHSRPGRLALAYMAFAPLAYARRLADRALGRLDEDAMPGPERVGWVSGAVLLIRRRAFEDVGGFDEDFFMNSEEVDLCARVARSGWDVVFVPDARIAHLGGGSSPSQERALAWLAEGHLRYTLKHYGRLSAWVGLAVAWLAWVASVPVWSLRAVLGRQTLRQATAEAFAYAAALKGARAHVL